MMVSRGLLLFLARRVVGFYNRQQVALFEDEELLAVHLELRAGGFGKEDDVAGADVHRNALATLIARARPDRDDGSLLGFFLGGLGQHEPAGSHFILLNGFHHHPVAEGFEIKCHLCLPPVEVMRFKGFWLTWLQVSTLSARVLTCWLYDTQLAQRCQDLFGNCGKRSEEH